MAKPLQSQMATPSHNRGGLELAEIKDLAPPASGKRKRGLKCKCPLNIELDDQKFLHQVVEFYHQRLLNHVPAQNYLRKRCILDNESIKLHRIGFADRELGRLVPDKNSKTGRAIRDRLTGLGIYRRQTGHGHFNGCVVFPIIDTENNIREIYGRKINDDLRPGTNYHLYLPTDDRPFSGRGLWNEKALAVHEEIILAESVIDAMSFWIAGYKNVTCIYGSQGMTPYHLAAFRKHKTKAIRLALDRDDDGKHATQKYSKQLLEMGIAVYSIQFPAGYKDANEYLQQLKLSDVDGGKVRDSLGSAVRQATWLGNGRSSEAPTTAADSGLSNEEDIDAVETTLQCKTNDSVEQTEPRDHQHFADCLDVDAEVKEQEIGFDFGNRNYRVRGLEKNLSYDQLKINLLARRADVFHVDTFDLYQSRSRAAFIKVTALELSLDEKIIKRDVGRILLKLEQLQTDQIQSKLVHDAVQIEMEVEAKAKALEFLNSPSLLSRILDDFVACGIVGEENNKLICYLAAISRKLGDPLAVLIQSSSAAGKSSLMDAVLSFIPEEDKVTFSAMTGQSLYYVGNGKLKHKILAISEEEGIRQATYAMKILQSEGTLRIASTGKNVNTGRLETQEYTVEGPVMLLLTTTRDQVDEELQNRCLTLSVCEDPAQTQAIHELQRQRQTIQGLLADHSQTVIQTLHQNAQRLLKPLLVVNNFAEELEFRSDHTSTRRDHAKYLTLIRVIALLHQYQRETKMIEHNGEKIEYIEVTRDDIEIANQLSAAVLARSYNTLPEKTEQVLLAIADMVAVACDQHEIVADDFLFTRKSVWKFLAEHQITMSATHLKRHLRQLEDCEYLIVHSGGGRGRLKTYQLDYDRRPTIGEGHEKAKKSTGWPSVGQDFFPSLSFGKNGPFVPESFPNPEMAIQTQPHGTGQNLIPS